MCECGQSVLNVHAENSCAMGGDIEGNGYLGQYGTWSKRAGGSRLQCGRGGGQILSEKAMVNAACRSQKWGISRVYGEMGDLKRNSKGVCN